MVVNDDAGPQTLRGVLWFFASELAPTVLSALPAFVSIRQDQ